MVSTTSTFAGEGAPPEAIARQLALSLVTLSPPCRASERAGSGVAAGGGGKMRRWSQEEAPP